MVVGLLPVLRDKVPRVPRRVARSQGEADGGRGGHAARGAARGAAHVHAADGEPAADARLPARAHRAPLALVARDARRDALLRTVARSRGRAQLLD
eukprot:4517659-Prymnesium_polylepis.1